MLSRVAIFRPTNMSRSGERHVECHKLKGAIAAKVPGAEGNEMGRSDRFVQVVERSPPVEARCSVG